MRAMLCANNLPYIFSTLVVSMRHVCLLYIRNATEYIELWNSSLHKLWKEICPPFEAAIILAATIF